MNTNKVGVSPRSLRSQQLAVVAKGFFDIPPRTRQLLILAGVCGVVILTVASLMGGQPKTIEVDKILHFSGYFILALVFVLGLRPTLYVPALLALVAFGFLIEELQPLTGRSREIRDAVANTVGVGTGALAGLIVRVIYSLIRKELTTAAVRRRLHSYPAGATILREGAKLSQFYIIKSGQVRLSRMINGQPKRLTTLGPGEVIGVMGVIQGTGQYATVEAIQPTIVYGMTLAELMDSAGGAQHPVSLVLAMFADKIHEAFNRINELESGSSSNSE